MDPKIALLAGFCGVADGGKISLETARDLREILSLFIGEIISEDDYFELIDELRVEGFIQTDGDFFTPTREGSALAQSLAERMIGQTQFRNFRRTLEEYQSEPKTYLKRISANIKSLQDRREKKTNDADMSRVQAVGIVLEVRHKKQALLSHILKISSDLLRDDDALTKEINASSHKLSRTIGCPVVATRRDAAELEIISFVKIDKFKLFSDEIDVKDIQEIDHSRVLGWNKSVASVHLEKALHAFGYIRSQWPGRDFIKYGDFQQVDTNLGSFREAAAFELDLQELADDKVFVWLQSYTSTSKRLIDFLKENFDQSSPEQIMENLGKLRLKSIPSGNEIQVKNILLEKDMASERIPGIGSTYLQYWKDTYGIDLTEKVQPIVIVAGRDTDFHYPAEAIFIDRHSLERFCGRPLERKTKTETPEQRASKSKALFESLKTYRDQTWEENVEIHFEMRNPTLKYLHDQRAVEKVFRIRQPMLEFSSGTVSLDPLNIFDSGYGAKCGRKTIPVSHFFAPKFVTDVQIDIFLKGLQRTFSSVGFGKILKSRDIRIVRFDEQNKADLENSIRSLDKVGDGSDHLGIIVVPDEHDAIYYAAKRLFPGRVGVPIQAIRLSSFTESQNEKFRGFRILCLKILIKSLKSGEAIWTLCDNAGLLPIKTLYVGIGYSAFPREGRVSKCATVLHDARGNKVSWRVFATIQTRTINKQWFDTLLLRIRDIVDKERPERLVFYRTGTMYPIELDAINSSFVECEWLRPIRTCFVSILDGSNHRFFLTSNHKNLPAGYAVVINSVDGLISSSNYDDRELRQGTVIPVRLKLEIGHEAITDILKEYHDLTYLNWTAPYTTSKHPLLMTIADRFAELTRENVPTENMFYLDL